MKHKKSNSFVDVVNFEAFKALPRAQRRKVFEKIVQEKTFTQIFQAAWDHSLDQSTCFEQAIQDCYQIALKETLQGWFY